ncbi:spa2 [Hyphodiscus hymeniophilus]|uniref:Spa2 n=1 Tax=Hyphodiscus hymeniophilus TaxID=353542 RepID=A0A9P7AZZ7_9HELO|nr:spa2 [Hyphodiscus hymeniophilus]
MNGRNGPLSPVSVGGSEWSGISKYQGLDTDSPYAPNPNNRGQLASPPISSGSTGTMNGGFPPRGSSSGSPGGPSPPASIARSSVGTGLYAGSDGGRSRKDDQFEATLSEHYVALKRYLAASLRDEKGNPRPNRARDKLLRLSPVQFQELSTDVFDELLRRQQTARRPNGNGPDGPQAPAFLLPIKNFHEKRNQARQKLSTLPPPRFRDLATDVFYELERRFPRFAAGDISRTDSPASLRGPPSRTGTPLGGSRGPSRIRRPSDASSVTAYSARSESRNGGPRLPINGNIPPSPGIPPNDFGRPTPKTFQSNTIVPNKSTMVEDDETGGEDNDDDDGDAFGLESAALKRESKKSAGSSETDKKLIDDYQAQVAELREKLDAVEDNLKQKDDELNSVLDNERNRSTAANMEKKEWSDLRLELESKLADAQNLNESLQSELDRVRSSQANSERDLRAQIQDLQESGGPGGLGNINPDLERENEDLRSELQEQQHVTDEVRREAQEFLREMRMLSERTTSSYDREEQLTAMVTKLEDEVKDWRNRYARTKTQLRGLRASSMGLTIQTARLNKDSAFTQEDGLVKDVHVTKFQISIDELLRTARIEDPQRVIEFMKSVVVNVRRITQDIDEAASGNADLAPQQAKLKSRVSATANNLITASKNFAAAKGLSPVSLLDAAASHLTSAIVELVRTVKIRPTPAGELEDDDDGNLEPVDTRKFHPVQTPNVENYPPPFLGLRNERTSADSSMYSPINSPRESTNIRPRSSRGAQLGNGINGVNGNKTLAPAPLGLGFGIRTQATDVEDLKVSTITPKQEDKVANRKQVYLDDQTAILVQDIQSLVKSIRADSGITAISAQITAIADVVGKVVSSTETAMSSSANGPLRSQGGPILKELSACRQRLVEAGERGRAIADEGREDDEGDREWRAWNQALPPIAFEIAKQTKKLVIEVDVLDGQPGRGGGDDDFS